MTTSMGVYEILNTVDGKRYIGSAVSFASRWRVHRHNLRNCRHHSPHLQRAWDKYGGQAFKFLPILTCVKSMLLFYEQQLLDKVIPEYNICRVAGSNLGRVFSPEARANISKGHMGLRSRLGTQTSAEARARISEAQKKRVIPPDVRAKMAASMLGRALTVEHRLKISLANTGKPGTFTGRTHTDATRALMSRSMRGIKKSPAHCAKIGARSKGISPSPEVRARISAKLKGLKRTPMSPAHRDKLSAAAKAAHQRRVANKAQ